MKTYCIIFATMLALNASALTITETHSGNQVQLNSNTVSNSYIYWYENFNGGTFTYLGPSRSLAELPYIVTMPNQGTYQFYGNQDGVNSNTLTVVYALTAPGGLAVGPDNSFSTPYCHASCLWSSVVGATSYNLKRDGTSIYTGTNTSYIDNSPILGTTNNYTVNVTTSAGASAYSSPVSYAAAPAAPTSLALTVGSDGRSINASWIGQTGTTAYSFTYTPQNGAAQPGGIAAGSPGNNTGSITDLTPGIQYSVIVYPYDTYSHSGLPSSTVSITLGGLPSKPTAVNVSNLVQGQATLSWASGDVSTISYHYQLVSGGANTLEGDTNATSVKLPITAGSNNSFRVQAINKIGASQYSDSVSFVGPSSTNGPTAPTLTGSTSSGKVLLSATSSPALKGTFNPAVPGQSGEGVYLGDVSGSVGYSVYRNGTQIASYTGSGSLAAANFTAWNDSTATPGQTYIYKVAQLQTVVVKIDNNYIPTGQIVYSNEISITSPNGSTPGAAGTPDNNSATYNGPAASDFDTRIDKLTAAVNSGAYTGPSASDFDTKITAVSTSINGVKTALDTLNTTQSDTKAILSSVKTDLDGVLSNTASIKNTLQSIDDQLYGSGDTQLHVTIPSINHSPLDPSQYSSVVPSGQSGDIAFNMNLPVPGGMTKQINVHTNPANMSGDFAITVNTYRGYVRDLLKIVIWVGLIISCMALLEK